jgi:intracellular sulfur oxidation DsrE/DsrF family protein
MTNHLARRSLLSAAVLSAGLVVSAQTSAPSGTPVQRIPGPVIDAYGGTFDVPSRFLMPPPDIDYKIKFDVGSPSDDPKAVNMKIDSVARFLNMHARAGVPRERMKLALVMHTTSVKDVITNDAYRRRFGADNPNLGLLESLGRAGVRLYVCGQSLAGRQYAWEEVSPAVTVALSAMTAHALLAREGYSTNPF